MWLVGICQGFLFKEWVIGPDVHGLLNVSGCALFFPVKNVEAIRTNWMSCGAGMEVNGGWGS